MVTNTHTFPPWGTLAQSMVSTAHTLLVDGFGGLYAAALMLCMAWCHMRSRNRLASGYKTAGKYRGNQGSLRSDGLSLQKEPADLHFPLLLLP